MDTIVVLIIAILALAIGIGAGYYISRTQYERAQRRNREKADKIVSDANERARAIELQARDDALKVSQAAEGEINRLRSELNKEEERLGHRRAELDSRVDRLEQREQAVNKRQSSVDRRANEIEKLHEDQLVELQRVAQLTPRRSPRYPSQRS